MWKFGKKMIGTNFGPTPQAPPAPPAGILEHSPDGARWKWRLFSRFPGSGIAVSLNWPPSPQRLYLDGWNRKGCGRCARGSISDFASLVRKSYSIDSSLISTLVRYTAKVLQARRKPGRKRWEVSHLVRTQIPIEAASG
jgi:hypothetical protein